MFFLLFVMFVMFGCYIKERKKIEKWGRSVNCEEEMREKNEMDEGDVCVWWGRRKKKGRGLHGWWGKKKKEKKKKKEMEGGEWGLRVWWQKRGSGKERRKKKLKEKKLNWFYLYVHFVWYKV